MQERLLRWWPALLLGIATIGAYGTAFYAVGVLLPVIAKDTGWRSGLLSGGYSLGVLGQGGVALLCGYTFDRRGSRPILLPALGLGSLFLVLASLAQSPQQFVVAWALGAAITGGGLFYNITMAVTARLYPTQRTTAFSVLTFLGALCSPIFYPLAAWFIDLWGWRGGLQALTAVSALCVLPAALLINAPAARYQAATDRQGGLGRALRIPAIHRALLVSGLAGFANAAIILHQVGALQAAGLSLAAASGFAGTRGAFQVPGRLVLTPLVNRFGVRGALGGCYMLIGTAVLALLAAFGGIAPTICAVYFAVMGGISLGLLSPLNGLFQAEVYGDARLGALNGVTVIIGSLTAAAGAWLTGLSVDLTGSYVSMALLIVAVQALTVLGLLWQRAAATGKEVAPAPTDGIADAVTAAGAE